MICPKCGREMTNTTPTKAYCMKCDLLVHLPSGVVFTGNPEEDKFIGCPGALLKENRKDFALTLARDALLLTWSEGRESRMEKVPYRVMAALDVGQRKQSEVTSLESAVGAAMIGLAFGALSVLEQTLTDVKTLKIKTSTKEYEVWVPEAAKWADRIRRELPSHSSSTLQLSLTAPSTMAQSLRHKFCRECGAKIPRDSTYCEECGARLA
jgi:ribosomal protein L40E